MKNLIKLLRYHKSNLASFIYFIIKIIIFTFVIFLILLFISYLFGTTVYCEGDLDKFLETTKGISNNNVNLNVSNPDLHVHNPNINVNYFLCQIIHKYYI